MLRHAAFIALFCITPCFAQTAEEPGERRIEVAPAPEPQDPFTRTPAVIQRAGPDIVSTGNACGADRYQHLIGRPLVEMRDASFPDNMNIVRHNLASSLEFKPGRLNVVLDARARIIAIACF